MSILTEILPPVSPGRMHFELRGCWVLMFNSIQILKVHYVRNQCRTWFCTVCRCPIKRALGLNMLQWPDNNINFHFTKKSIVRQIDDIDPVQHWYNSTARANIGTARWAWWMPRTLDHNTFSKYPERVIRFRHLSRRLVGWGLYQDTEKWKILTTLFLVWKGWGSALMHN